MPKYFLLSVTASQHYSIKHFERILSYVQYTNNFEFSVLTFPVRICDIPKLRKNNNISLNLLGCEKKNVSAISHQRKGIKTCQPHMIHKGENHHYCSIKNFNRLIGD